MRRARGGRQAAALGAAPVYLAHSLDGVASAKRPLFVGSGVSYVSSPTVRLPSAAEMGLRLLHLLLRGQRQLNYSDTADCGIDACGSLNRGSNFADWA